MKLKLLAAVCAFAIGSAASAQITETVTPLVPLSPSDQQILNVQQAERQIQANEQAVALEKARAAEKAARQRAAAQARQAKARAEAKAAQQARHKRREPNLAPHQECCSFVCLVFQNFDLVRSRSAFIKTKRNNNVGGSAAGNRFNLRICLIFGRFEDFLYS